MGHALNEACRVLKPDGCIIDIRPCFPVNQGNQLSTRQQVFCLMPENEMLVGTLARDYGNFYFADRVLSEVISDGQLGVKSHTKFNFRYYLNDLAIFDLYRADRWDKAHMSVGDRRCLERFILRHPGATIRVDTPVQLTILKKL